MNVPKGQGANVGHVTLTEFRAKFRAFVPSTATPATKSGSPKRCKFDPRVTSDSELDEKTMKCERPSVFLQIASNLSTVDGQTMTLARRPARRLHSVRLSKVIG
jgi:hypothetical protein